MRALARNPAAIPRARNMTVTMYMRRFMPVSQSYTRVLSFYRLVRPELRETLLARVRVAQRALSNVIPLLHYFLTDFLLVHPHLATRTMFTQNGMYQASMIFRQTMQHGGAAGERRQLLGDLPRELVNHWATFAEQAHVEHVDPLVNLSRLASEEFKKLAPVFRQHLADRLEMRIKSFVRFRILTSQDEVTCNFPGPPFSVRVFHVFFSFRHHEAV
ncbi:hypothetical protein BC940DRAFT_300926 [Gongronella butleri]|nr:hypothetical protein BC940DRAFT_300926 [Gongronella butleri]